MTALKSKTQQYLSRLRCENGVDEVLCNYCGDWQPTTGFHRVKGKFKSICKKCHKAKYSTAAGYRTPSAVRKSEEAKVAKLQWLNEEKICPSCGDSKPRSEFYNERQKKYLPHCCSIRRNEDEVLADIAEQMKTCFECGLRMPFDEFASNASSRDGRQSHCKCCAAARMKSYSDNPDRMRLIKETDDGTLSVKFLSAMLRAASNCSHCGVELTTTYPVGRTSKTIDHDVPLARGGKHSADNVAILCLGCNSSKQTRTMAEFSRVVKKKRPE